jgi:hypothetical protein
VRSSAYVSAAKLVSFRTKISSLAVLAVKTIRVAGATRKSAPKAKKLAGYRSVK